MKNLACLILLSAALLSASCSKRPHCCVSPNPELITAQRNGVNWTLPIIKSEISKNKVISLSTVGPQLLYTATDSLAINLQYTGIGTYTPSDLNIAYTVFSNGSKTSYMLDQTYENRIEITDFVPPQNEPETTTDPTEMKATFNLRFTDPGHTTTVTFLDGKIAAHLGN